MKKILFTIAFSFVSTLTFASVGEKERVSETPKKEEAPEVVEKNNAWHCFDFNDSCGGSWVVCHNGVITQDLVAVLWEWDGGC